MIFTNSGSPDIPGETDSQASAEAWLHFVLGIRESDLSNYFTVTLTAFQMPFWVYT